MIIDKNYPGLVRREGYYFYDGDIILDENLYIFINLYVGGSIEVGDCIKATGWVKAGRYIKAFGKIKANEFITSDEWISTYGIKTNEIFFITNKKWHITVMDTHIKIGCELHSKEKWANFSDEEIDRMNSEALDFWNKEKDLILSL